jgi:hypothetical protein
LSTLLELLLFDLGDHSDALDLVGHIHAP